MAPESFLSDKSLKKENQELKKTISELKRQLERLGGWGEKIEHEIKLLRSNQQQSTERLEEKIMAGVQELQDALTQLDSAIGTEVGQINAKLDELRNQVAPNLQPQVDAVKASIARIEGIVADAAPEPEPGPAPTPPPERRR